MVLLITRQHAVSVRSSYNLGGGSSMKKRSLALFILLAFAIAAWAREDRLTNTGLNPAAEGKITTENDRNGNTKVEVEVKHMAMPQALTPVKQSYVVWVQPRGK